MISKVSDCLDAIDHLPAGASLVVHQFGWDDYEQLIEDLADRRHVRVSYDRGKLEVMSPLSEHELYVVIIERLAYFVAEELGLAIEGYGIATWRRRRLSRGVEADASFYVTRAADIIGKRTINLDSDPAPDLVVEIDITNESLSKFPIYAALGVAEIWRYDGATVQFFALTGDDYSEIAESRCLPGLGAQMLSGVLEMSKTEGQTAALASFRQRWAKR